MGKYAILIAGKMGTGKSTFANMLGKYEEDSIIMPLAAPLKLVARDVFGWDGEKDEKGRRLLQVLGTEAGRAYNENLWVDKLITRFKGIPYSFAIVDDVRFDNEVTRCKERLDVCWCINLTRETGNTSTHLSEAGINPELVDFNIMNEADSLVLLEHIAIEILNQIYDDLD